MRLHVLPEARLELLAAREWYESQAPGLGTRFGQAVETAITSALHAPYGYPCIEAEFRRVLLRKFPYILIYHAKPDELTIIALHHQRKKPMPWLSRLKP